MKALYRKYRPKSLSEVIGQEQIVKALKSAIQSNNFSHAYLFTGPRGTGKTSVARIFAHEINNFNYELEDSYVDIIEIDAASNTGVDNIRDLREKAVIAPTNGKYKVYIIDEVHMLSKSAFNALLKTLEEPPEHVVFILATTELQKVPITITSRVQVYNFRLATADVMLNHLKTICEQEKVNIEDEALKIIIRRGGGSFRDTLSLLDQVFTLQKENKQISKQLVEESFGLPQDEQINQLLEAYKQNDFQQITETLQDILCSGSKPETISEEIIIRILEKPDKELLPLLSKLPEVNGAFPEAKLLLALTFCQTSPAQTNAPRQSSAPRQMNVPDFIKKSSKTFQKTEQTISENFQKISQKPSENFQNEEKINTESQKNTPSTPEKTTTQDFSKSKQNPGENSSKSEQNITENSQNPTNPSTTNNNFSWESFQDTVKKASMGTAMWLKKCKYKQENQNLHLYPPTPTIKGILESENNRRVLIECLPKEIGLKIHDAGENPNQIIETNPKISLINDIMGKTQEVNNDGEIPF